MIEGLNRAISETRAVISSLHPATAQELGFEPALRSAIAPFPQSRTVYFSVQSTVDEQTLAATVLLRIAQELVVNAVKHARPTRIDVLVSSEDEQIVVEVNDDGVGIDTLDASRALQAGHVGLAMVRRHVEDVGGTLEIATRPDGGTHSRVVLPVPRLTGPPARALKREWPRPKRPEPSVGRMFYYVLDPTRLTCLSLRKRIPRRAVAAAPGGKAGIMGYKI